MNFKSNTLFAAIATSAALLSTQAAAADGTLEKVVKNGYLQCGVSTGLPGSQTLTQKENGKVLMLNTAKPLLLPY